MHRVPQVDALECVWQRRVTDRAQGTKVPLDQKTFSWQEDDLDSRVADFVLMC
jgi:hypothetical protein